MSTDKSNASDYLQLLLDKLSQLENQHGIISMFSGTEEITVPFQEFFKTFKVPEFSEQNWESILDFKIKANNEIVLFEKKITFEKKELLRGSLILKYKNNKLIKTEFISDPESVREQFFNCIFAEINNTQ